MAGDAGWAYCQSRGYVTATHSEASLPINAWPRPGPDHPMDLFRAERWPSASSAMHPPAPSPVTRNLGLGGHR